MLNSFRRSILLTIHFVFSFSWLLSNTVIAQDVLAPETLWKFGRVGEPQLSPDGKTVIYSVRRYDLAANRGKSDVYKINADGTGFTPIISDSLDVSAAKWSADGKSIFYLFSKSGTNQIWTMNADGS